MTTLYRAIVRAYDSATHKADVQLAASFPDLVTVPVSREIPAADVTLGTECSVLFHTDDNPDDAVLLCLHGAAPTAGNRQRIIDKDLDTYVHTELNADEDKVRVVIAGTLRLLVQAASPEVDVTGDVRVSAGIGFRGTAPSTAVGLNSDWTATGVSGPDLLRGILRATDTSAGARGVTGEVQIPGTNANAIGYARGLEFKVNHSGTGTVTDHMGAMASIEGTGPATNRMGVYALVARLINGATIQAGVRSRMQHTGAVTGGVAAYDAYRSEGLMTNATITDFHHFRATDITLAGGAVITNHYGVRVGALTFGTNRRPFWDEGIAASPSDAAGNRFRSNTAFGTLATTGLFGAGDGVVFLADPTTVPTADPTTAGTQVHSVAGAIIARSSSNFRSTLNAAGDGTGVGSDRYLHRIAETVETTDATVTTLASYTLPDETIAHVRAVIVARTAGGADAAYERSATVSREGGAGAVLVGAVSALHTAEDTAAWDATLDVNGNDVRVRVTGAAATTIRWLTHVEIVGLTAA